MAQASPRRATRPLALLSALFCVTVWAVFYPALKVALAEMTPLAFTGVRFVVAATITLAWTALERQPLLPPRGQRALAGFLALSGVGVYQWFFIVGLAGTSGFAAALLNSTSPLLSLLIVSALGWERPPGPAVAGTVIAYGGVVLFILSARGDPSLGSLGGNLLCLGSAACWAAFSVATSRAGRSMAPGTVQAVTFGGGTLVLLPYCLPAVASTSWSGVSPTAWTILVLSAILPLAVSFRLWAFSLRTLGVAATTRFGLLVPVLAGVTSAVATGERFTPAKLGSAAVVLAGLALVRLSARR